MGIAAIKLLLQFHRKVENIQDTMKRKPFQSTEYDPLSFICYETQAIQERNENSLDHILQSVIRKGSSSEKERKVNALASGADEGRD